MRPYSPVLLLLFVQLMHFLLLKEIFRFVSMLCFVEGRGQTSPKDNVFDWSHSFYHFYCANLYNLHFDLEVSQIYRIIYFLVADTYIILMVNMIIFRLIKSDQNIMMLNLCASLILAYVIFISVVEETENEVVFLLIK